DLSELEKAATRATKLTGQLLAFSRKQVLKPEVLDVNAIVNGVAGMLRRLIGEDIEIRMNLASSLKRIEADAGQLEQVILNLVVNSRDAMPAGGKLMIETVNIDLDDEYASRHVSVTPGPHVLLAITDTGAGMTPEVQARIFEPFFTTKERGK